MNSKRALFLLGISAIFVLTSCSGLKSSVCNVNCGGSGNSSLSLTISDTPPSGTSILSFTLPISGISLTPSGGGSQVSVFSSADFELTRLQSDSNLIAAKVPVAEGTYTAVNVTVAAPLAVFINASGSTVGSCVAGSVCHLTGIATTITYTFPTGSPLVLTANANQWLNLDFNYNKAIVATNGIGVDMTQTGVLTASTTVPTGIPSGDVANIDDFTGAVTALSTSSITLESSVRGTLTASISSTIPVYDPQSQCQGQGTGSLSCIGVGSIVSLQGVLSNAGVVSGTSLDVIDASTTPADEVEGTIYPSSCNGAGSFGLILSDSVIFTSGSPLTSANFGAGVCLTVSQAATFAIDDGILTGQGVPTVGFTNSSNILQGQTVRAKVTGAATGANGINVTATALILRFSRLTGIVNFESGYVLTVNGLPTYLTTGSLQAVTYPGVTVLEGATDVSSLSGDTVSFSALYLAAPPAPYPFQAAKVRVP
jgi:hypothetical protein